MNHSTPITAEQRRLAEAAVAAAWEAGCPVASSPHQEIADVCLRRRRSLARRGVDSSDRPSVIRDLAKGMIAAFETAPNLVGPLAVDYEYLASRVLDAVESSRS